MEWVSGRTSGQLAGCVVVLHCWRIYGVDGSCLLWTEICVEWMKAKLDRVECCDKGLVSAAEEVEVTW